ncbi:MAG: hypothetical protein GEV06_26625 [Luteitalea sp.]|nr:hypothetical protein [Luteitalea sp.]
MRLAAKAWRLREAARESLEQGDFTRAFEQASDAQRIHRTPRGASLQRLSAWLSAPLVVPLDEQR